MKLNYPVLLFMAHYSLYSMKTVFMKQVIERLFVKDEARDPFQWSSTIFMILLFLTFWGVSFYVLVNSLA
jgi:hypothetical protein